MADGATKMEDDDAITEMHTDEEEEMDPSVPFPHGAQLLPKPPPAAWIAKQLNPAPPPSKNQGGAAPKSPGSAKTWPPAIDAKASKAIEHARMKADARGSRQQIQRAIHGLPKKPNDWKGGTKTTTKEANSSTSKEIKFSTREAARPSSSQTSTRISS